MFIKVTPESAGISSESVLKLLKTIDSHGLSSHSVLIARGDKLICEAYWKPFDRTTPHRMYSQTKSYVGLAVRLLADENIISLDDKIISYFPDKLPKKLHPWLEALTIRDMLMMRTCFDEYGKYWFKEHNGDRVRLYFSQRPSVMPGTEYHYDSMGSFVLGALVEKLTGKPFLDYLREKCLNDIGFSETARCLKSPDGHSWGDSALICTPEDMLGYGRLIGRYGEYNGKQLIRRGIIEEAFNDDTGLGAERFSSYSHRGYISQFWRFYNGAVGFNGMHDQVTLYHPKTDITFTCTSGNARGTASREVIISYLFSEIIETAGEPLPENKEAFARLEEYTKGLKLVSQRGKAYSSVENGISGKIFFCEPNKAGISEFSLTFRDKTCEFRYKNAQGEKLITLGRLENVFQQFPETGYSAETGGVKCEGHTYRCAASFAWDSVNQMNAAVQIIDEYIGNLFMGFSFGDGYARLRLDGDAENFLEEYNGRVNAFLHLQTDNIMI